MIGSYWNCGFLGFLCGEVTCRLCVHASLGVSFTPFSFRLRAGKMNQWTTTCFFFFFLFICTPFFKHSLFFFLFFQMATPEALSPLNKQSFAEESREDYGKKKLKITQTWSQALYCQSEGKKTIKGHMCIMSFVSIITIKTNKQVYKQPSWGFVSSVQSWCIMGLLQAFCPARRHGQRNGFTLWIHV